MNRNGANVSLCKTPVTMSKNQPEVKKVLGKIRN